MIILCCLILCGLFFLPFAPGIYELKHGTDAEPLAINMGPAADTSNFSGDNLFLPAKCSFKQLYGLPIITGSTAGFAKPADDYAMGSIPAFTVRTTARNITKIPPGSCTDNTIITGRQLTIGEQAVIRGHIKAYGNITTEPGVIIAGNVFSEGDIRLGAHTTVCGTVFAQGHIFLDEGVTVGVNGKIKSVIGTRGISMGRGIRVYGLVRTEGEGRVV